MKRSISLILALTLLLTMAGCAGKAPETTPVQGSVENTAPTAAAPARMQPGYVLQELPGPDWLWDCTYLIDGWDTWGDTIWIGRSALSALPTVASYDTLNDSWQRYELDTGEARYPYLECISAAEDCLWVLLKEWYSAEEMAARNFSDDRDDYYVLRLDLTTGDSVCSRVPFQGNPSTESSSLMFNRLIAVDGERALLTSEASAYVIDTQANILDQPELSLSGAGDYYRVNNVPYFWTERGSAPLDLNTFRFGPDIGTQLNSQFSSNAGHFLHTEEKQLFVYEPATGEDSALFNWLDVALSYRTMGGWFGLENTRGEIFYPMGKGLVKVTEGMVPVKKPLVLACFGDSSGEMYQYQNSSFSCSEEMMDAIVRFNNTDPEYRIEIRPIVYSGEAELNRLLIELATADDIDLLDTSFLPESAQSTGLLEDMLPYLDADDSISREDFVAPLLNAMLKKGHLYAYTTKFTMLTILTAPENFPGRENWTVENIQNLMAEHTEALPIVHWMDKDMQKKIFTWAASAEFVDWDNASCSFDGPTFLHWLELLQTLPAGGEYVDAPKLMMLSYDLATEAGIQARDAMGEGYVAAGFPETAGTGSYFLPLGTSLDEWRYPLGVNTQLGMMAAGGHKEGAWRFVRTLMQGEEETNVMYGIPAFKAAFERALEGSIRKVSFVGNENTDLFNAQDAELLRQQVYHSQKAAHLDQAVVTLIGNELDAFLAGQKTAENAARQIQSRVSIYLAEQS